MRRAGRAAAVAALVLVVATGCGGPPAPAVCTATTPDGGRSLLTPEQAANAATVAAVGLRLGAPDHAVTVALATARQESGLRNLAYGDRDSLGLFQQRPSQGWGTAAQVQDPAYAARAFYRRLLRVPGWQALSVTAAAQAVQLSAFPTAYADHEDDSRVLARVLTGEVPAGLACSGLGATRGLQDGPLREAAARELGAGTLQAGTAKGRWVAAAWLVAHARTYGVRAVTAEGRRWSGATGQWRADAAAGAVTWS